MVFFEVFNNHHGQPNMNLKLAARIIAKEDPHYVVNWKSENGFVILTSPMIIALADKVTLHWIL